MKTIHFTAVVVPNEKKPYAYTIDLDGVRSPSSRARWANAKALAKELDRSRRVWEARGCSVTVDLTAIEGGN